MSETPSKEKAPIEASTNKTFKVKVGSVITVGVRVDGAQKPTITTPDGRSLFVSRDPSGAWVGSWASMDAGEHQLVAAIPDHSAVLFTVTTTEES